jgi:hypothetical protein
MKRKLFFISILSVCILPAFADEAIVLKHDEVVRLKVPAANPELSRVEYEDEMLYKPRTKGSNYFDEKESVFESRAGKAFSKFIDDWAIDNKINNYASKVAE